MGVKKRRYKSKQKKKSLQKSKITVDFLVKRVYNKEKRKEQIKMKKYLRITIMDRFGPASHFKPYTYIVNKKFCDNWKVPFEGRTKYELKVDLEAKCKAYGIKLISIE